MKQFALLFAVMACLVIPTSAQQPGQPLPRGLDPYIDRGPAPGEDLPKFDLDFPGGTVDGFVKEVQQALLKVDGDAFLNVVIPTEYHRQSIPALKLRNVNVLQLFKTLEMASQRTIDNPRAGMMNQYGTVMAPTTTARYGFQTSGPVTRESIWYFYVEKPQEKQEQKALRYFQLAPYLNQYTMDDIGRAIEGGWNMLEENEQTKLNFHKETKLLIAVGPPHQLETIAMVLRALDLGMTNSPASDGQPKRSMPKPEPAPKL